MGKTLDRKRGAAGGGECLPIFSIDGPVAEMLAEWRNPGRFDFGSAVC